MVASRPSLDFERHRLATSKSVLARGRDQADAMLFLTLDANRNDGLG